MLSAADRVVVLGLAVLDEAGAGRPVRDLYFDRNGVVGDALRAAQGAPVRLLDWAVAEKAAGAKILPGQSGEHLLIRGLDALGLRLGDVLAVGPVTLEVGGLPGGGLVHARVRRGGAIRVGGWVHHTRRRLRVRIITLSDRASRGVYADRSGPAIAAALEAWGAAEAWAAEAEHRLIPDDGAAFGALLREALEDGCDLVVSTGSTGCGPRDVAPETVRTVADREIPGIMEHVRIKYGAAKPTVRLSRSVAATAGETAILALPGSVRAVEEYLAEITPLLGHLILGLRGAELH